MKKFAVKFVAAVLAGSAVLLSVQPAWADIKVGISLPLTGPASGLGIPVKNGFALWPSQIAGEKVVLTILDDAGDPTTGVKNARRFVSEDKVDLVIGSAATPVAIAMAETTREAQTPQLAMSPAALPEGKDTWFFRIPHSAGVMANALLNHMKAHGVKTVGFLGYTDAYGEVWLKEMTARAPAAGITIGAVERFARTDTSVTAQALKITSSNPDAILIVASGSGAAMPHRAIVERGFRGKIYQTHAAASHDLMRVGGKDVEGAFVVSGPAVVADQLPDSNPSKKPALAYVAAYEKQFGAGSRNQFAAHAFDTLLMMEAAVPVALKKAKPGTPEFRAALRDAFESTPGLAVSQGVLDYSPKDHWGFRPDTGVILKVVNGDWKLEK